MSRPYSDLRPDSGRQHPTNPPVRGMANSTFMYSVYLCYFYVYYSIFAINYFAHPFAQLAVSKHRVNGHFQDPIEFPDF